MILLLAETEVREIPRALWKRRSVKRMMERLGTRYPVTDCNFVPDVCKTLGTAGRPDILHISLLLALESPLAKNGELEVYFSLRDGRVFRVLPGTRLPRGYHRFLGLLGKTLHENGSEFIVPSTLPEGEYILFHEEGERLPLSSLPEGVYVVGAFPHGDFVHSYHERLRVSIYPEPLNTWDVVSRVIVAREFSRGLLTF